tara:strand:+ start:1692 stop:2561 length:870 start_codon:yes stop_codon:yes gene_type:complete
MKRLIKKIIIKLPFLNFSLTNNETKFPQVKNSPILKEIFLKGNNSYEPEVFSLIKNSDYDIFIDCGANIGLFSCFAYRKGIETIAIEPLNDNIKYLKKLFDLNNYKIDLIKKGISDQAGKFKIYVPDEKKKFHAHSSLQNQFKDPNSPYFKNKFKIEDIETTTLNNIFELNDNFLDKKILLKVDIEGNELKSLTCFKEILKEKINIDVLVEIMINDVDKQEIFNLMIDCGYESYLLTNAGFVEEKRPLTLPKYDNFNQKLRTCWKNHFFTKKNKEEIKKRSLKHYNYFI